MSLQKFNQKLEELTAKYQRKIDEQQNEFEKKHEEFLKKYQTQQTEFSKEIENLKQTTIDSLLKQSKSVQVKPKITDRGVNADLYAKFDKKPYLIIPASRNAIHVYIPKFYPDFQVGWLKDEVDEYYRYEVNQYSIFFGDVPKEILDEIKMPEPIRANVSGDKIKFNPEDKQKIKRQIPKFLTDWTDNSARITKGHEFDIISQILESGHIPFDKTPVAKEDLISNHNSIKLREYQTPVWNNFLKTGASGIFHPTGSGKSFIGMKGLESIKVGKRRNLIVSPRRALVEQWNYYLQTNIPHVMDNVLISTYQGFKNFDEEFGLTIYDECQGLPAPKLSRLSTIKTKYRMGLSATPFREDGKNHLIVTLTGHPEPINWPYYMQKWGPGYHQINVHFVSNRTGKIAKARQLYNPRKRTMFYCYHIDIGGDIAGRLNIPHIHGETEDRLQAVKDNHSFVASSVFVEGVSIDDLDHIIEADFHFGSRTEELQLTGRLMHSLSKNKRHDIIMTQQEFDDYKKRILVLEEKGFHVKLIGGEQD